MATRRSSFSAGFVPRPERCGRKAALGFSKACQNISYRRRRYGNK